MKTLQEELAWEQLMIDSGVARYKAIQATAVAGGREDDTSASRRLLVSYIDGVSQHIKDYLEGRNGVRRAPEAKVLLGMDTDKLALISLKVMLTSAYKPNLTVMAASDQIGKRVEDEFHFMSLELANKEYFDAAIRSMEEKATANYKYKRNSILQSAQNNTEFEINYWTHTQRALVGLILLQLVRETTDLFEVRKGAYSGNPRKKDTNFLVASDACIEWINKHDAAMSLLMPDRMPSMIEPRDWTSPYDGGYYLPQLQAITPLIIRDKLNPNKQRRLYQNAEMPKVLSAVNWMQRTGWQINSRVLEVMREVWTKNLVTGMPRSEPFEFPVCPLAPDAQVPKEGEQGHEDFMSWKAAMRVVHSLEAERKALCVMVSRNLRMAAELEKLNEFYYVYRCDFRGRIYPATTGISPQGADTSKALLQFSDAEELGDTGLYWLKVHGANKFGNDKCSYDERVAWVDENSDKWCAVASDPVTHRSIWGAAEKPYQFLAFCFEYADALRLGSAFKSRLPVAMDGSCNGLQHFSAMLRDEVGGSAVNLVPASKPSDIYQQVADVAMGKLMQMASYDVGARNWLRLFRKLQPDDPRMPRKLSKKPVMTLPYGSTQRTATSSIYEWYVEYGDNFFAKLGYLHAISLTPVLWESINEVVVAARAAMDWIQDCAAIVGKSGHDVAFTTPLGFPVIMRNPRMTERKVKTALCGGIVLRMRTASDDRDVRKMRQGSSPNFVHAADATHEMMVVNKAAEYGIRSFAMIHDDFGVPARHVAKFHEVIRECFIALYKEHDLLTDFGNTMREISGEDMPPMPATGTLNLEDVRNSKYFFG